MKHIEHGIETMQRLEMNQAAAKSLNRTILRLMAQIEDMREQMMHQIDTKLDDRCRDVLDSTNVSLKHVLIRDLEEMERNS